MPLEIRNKRTNVVEGNAVAGNSIRCGHCDYPIVDDTKWYAIDDPYYCLVHETCLTFFNFNGVSRLALSTGRQQARRALDSDIQTLQRMVTRAWWQKRGVPEDYQLALQHLLALHVSLRTAKVIEDDPHSPSADGHEVLPIVSRENLAAAAGKT